MCCTISVLSTPGYGERPRENTSQHVTPNDHCSTHNTLTTHTTLASSYHVSVFVADAVVQCLWRHPLDWESGTPVSTVVVSGVDVSSESKVSHPDGQVMVHPARERCMNYLQHLLLHTGSDYMQFLAARSL